MYINRDSISKICIVSKQPRPRMLQTKYNDVVSSSPKQMKHLTRDVQFG